MHIYRSQCILLVSDTFKTMMLELLRTCGSSTGEPPTNGVWLINLIPKNKITINTIYNTTYNTKNERRINQNFNF